MSQYATLADVKAFGIMPSEDVDDLETRYPGITLSFSTGVSSHFDGFLSKRYLVPLTGPLDPALVFNVVQQVVARLYLRRGYNPSSQQDQLIRKTYEDADAWLKQIADPQSGLAELVGAVPLSGQAGGVSLGGPLAYGELNPYSAQDAQAAAVRSGCP